MKEYLNICECGCNNPIISNQALKIGSHYYLIGCVNKAIQSQYNLDFKINFVRKDKVLQNEDKKCT